MLVAKVQNGQVIAVADHKVLFNTVVFPTGRPTPEWMAANSVMPVESYIAFDSLTHKKEGTNAYIQDGKVYTVHAVELTAEEIAANKVSAMAKIRAQRDEMLKACDWVAIKAAETGTAVPTDWATYRAALRDLPATIENAGTDPRTFKDWPRDPNWVDFPGV